jgi:hypothetical protein
MGTKKMSPFAGAATAKVKSPQRDVERPSQLERVVGFESARWLPSVLSDLRLLETSGQNIPGVGDLRVSHSTADHVRRLLTVISEISLPQPVIAPFSGGGVALTYNIGERELTFTAYPAHDDFVFMRTDDNGNTSDGIITLDQTKDLSDVITTFLADPAR